MCIQLDIVVLCNYACALAMTKGLEDQLLDLTMQKEQPRLFKRRIHLVQQQNEFTILLADLENTLLREISSAEVGQQRAHGQYSEH